MLAVRLPRHEPTSWGDRRGGGGVHGFRRGDHGGDLEVRAHKRLRRFPGRACGERASRLFAGSQSDADLHERAWHRTWRTELALLPQILDAARRLDLWLRSGRWLMPSRRRAALRPRAVDAPGFAQPSSSSAAPDVATWIASPEASSHSLWLGAGARLLLAPRAQPVRVDVV